MKRRPMPAAELPRRKIPLRARQAFMRRGRLNRSTEITRAAQEKAQRPTVTAEERAARAAVTARSGGLCEVCRHRYAYNWHHRQNRGRGKVGKWCASNGLHLCGSGTTGCHGDITARPAWARRHGWSVPSWADPAATPVLLIDRGWVLLDNTGNATPCDPPAGLIPDADGVTPTTEEAA